MRALSRQVVGLGTILWLAALIVVSYHSGFLRAAPEEPWSDARLDALDRELAHREVHLWMPGSDRVWILTGADVALATDRLATRALATARLSTGAASTPVPSLPVLTLEEWRIRSWLRERVAGPMRVEPEPARLDRSGRIVPDRPGRRLDQEEAVRRVREALFRPEAAQGPVRVEIPLRAVPATVTEEMLRALAPWELLASFTTRFDPTDLPRAANIRLGATLLDGALVESGRVFSFNQVVGPRTEARGFKPAPIIVSRQLVSGIGGGVCQLSSTTYNAALLAGLQVVERRPHSIPVGYLPLGRDATVFDNLIDLKFRNNLGHPVVIQAYVEEDRLTVAVWGDPGDRRRIEVRTRTVETLPPPLQWEDGRPVDGPASLGAGEGNELPEGLEVVAAGRTGYVVDVERVFYTSDGRVARVESLARDVYPPEPRRLRHRGQRGS